MRTYSVNEVADTLIAMAREEGIAISNLKLQKLMYYAQAWNLAFCKKPLFKAKFEAWVHGPVIPELFRRFKEHRWSTIIVPVTPVKDPELREYLGKILRAYGKYGASQLEQLSHDESPWKDARDGTPPEVPSNAHISDESMKIFYTRMAHEKRAKRAASKR